MPPILSEEKQFDRCNAEINDRRDESSKGGLHYWAIAHDPGMSGWGKAENGKSYFAFPVPLNCDRHVTLAEAFFKARPDFKRGRINTNLPRLKTGDHLSISEFPWRFLEANGLLFGRIDRTDAQRMIKETEPTSDIGREILARHIKRLEIE